MKKKLLSLVLAGAMLCSVFAPAAFAEEAASTAAPQTAVAAQQEEPTAAPTAEPSEVPTEKPTAAPTEEPTAAPTEEPTAAPTEKPTAAPTEEPTAAPTEKPTAAPTEEPTAAPTEKPTAAPTEKPTATPAAEAATSETATADTLAADYIPVYLKLNDGKLGNETGTVTRSVAKNGSFSEILSKNVPTRDGYSFDGWYYNNVKVTADRKADPQKNSYTFEARWNSVGFKVTLNPNGGSVNPTTITVVTNDAYGKYNSNSLPTPVRSDYSFDGWYKESGTNQGLVTKDTIVHDGNPHTLVAHWTSNYEKIMKLTSFVERLYSVCFGRSADESGRNYWVGLLFRGERSGAEVAAGFVFSTEFQNMNLCNTHYVKALYKAFFNREADAIGLGDWVGKLDTGTTRGRIFNGFIGSAEFANLCANYGIQVGTGDWTNAVTIITGNCTIGGEINKTVYDFVDRLYTTCLDRPSDSTGRNYWVAKLRTGVSGRETASGFVFSQEFKNKNYSNSDFVEHLYLAFFGRASDAAGKADWVGQLNRGTSRDQVFDGFARSTEFSILCAQYGIVRG